MAALPVSTGFAVAAAFEPELEASVAPSALAAASDGPSDEPPSDESPSPEALDVAVDGVARRSFLAQPDPLKWTAGAEIALRIGPLPQIGQLVGPSAWTP